MIKELYSRNWDFTLYQKADDYVISVVFFGLVDFHRSFYLNTNEFNENYEELKNLSEQIRNNYDNYKIREVTPAITNEAF
jgi:plasmid replication initiation protein